MSQEQDLDKPFLYQINFNRRKYPEICEALEEAKKSPNGIAWYLRDLIQRDIDSKKDKIQIIQQPIYEVKPKAMDEEVVDKTEQELEEIKRIEEEEFEEEFEDDTGGFL